MSVARLAAMLLVTIAPVAHAAAPSRLEARVQRLEDHQAIERMLLEYGHALDTRDFATYAGLFASQGEWQGALGTYRGPAAIQAAMEKIFADAATDIPKGSNFHMLTNVVIDIQGDRATASSRFLFVKMNKGKPESEVAGRYEDILIREKGVWRFLRRTALPPG
jgi:hypothetical protein